MPFLRFADDAAMYDSTPLDNMFIIENLPSAPEAFLKVYIYARMLCIHPELGGVEELSRALRMDDEMIENAFAYWERAGFMRRVADNPPEYVFLPARGAAMNDMDRDYYKYRDFNGDLQALFPAGKLMHPAQYSLANDWLNVYGFEQGAVIALVKNAIANSRSKSPDPARIFKTVEKKVLELAKANITDTAGVEKLLSRDKRTDKLTRDVLRYFGMCPEPTAAETELTEKWLRDWGFTPEGVLEACKGTAKAHNPSFAYLDKILENSRASSGAFERMQEIFRIMGITNNPSEEQRKWYDKQLAEGFQPETIELAARQQARRSVPSFGGLEFMVGRWREKKLFSFADANEFVTRSQSLLAEYNELLSKNGIEKRPNEDELAAYEEWKRIMPSEIIQLAAENSRGKSYPITYMYSLLEKWRELGITDNEAAKAALSGRFQPRQSAPVQSKLNPALNYQQREYRNEDFDGDAFMEEARRLMEQQDSGFGG